MRQLADSTLMQKALVAVGTEKSTAMLQVFKNLTDIDLMKDIDRAYAWGRVKDDNSVVFVLRGRFNPEKVVTLLEDFSR